MGLALEGLLQHVQLLVEFGVGLALGGDLAHLIVMHDVDRWADLPLVAEVEGFRIVRAG